MRGNNNFEDLDELELEDVQAFIRETLGLFNEFAGDNREELSDRSKGVLITLERRLTALSDAVHQDATIGDEKLYGQVDNPMELVKDVGSGNTNLEFEELDFEWLEEN